MLTEPAQWQGLQAIRYRGDRLEAVVLPGRGGKIASLRDWTGREWLAQPPGPLAGVPWPPGSFTSGDMCGWDECAPTIIACEVAGTQLPDHGELWQRSWQAGSDDLHVSGSAWDYTFARRITFDGPSMTLDYRVTSAAGIPAFLWAAHPQFSAGPGTSVILPETVTELADVSDFASQPAPMVPGPGQMRVGSFADNQGRKFYASPETKPAWAQLRHAGGRELRLSWAPQQIPYLGIWIDRHVYAREDVVALEPSTGFYDSCELALRLGRVPAIRPGGELRWTLTLTISTDADELGTEKRSQS